ncbi:hypothetical protein D3C80_1631280 [compost metagenome]
MLRQTAVHQAVLVKRLLRIVGQDLQNYAVISREDIRAVARLQLIDPRHILQQRKLIFCQAKRALHLQIHQPLFLEKGACGIQHIRPGRLNPGEEADAQHNNRKNRNKAGLGMPDLPEDILP